MDNVQTRAHFSLPSIIAIGSAIGSYFVHPFGGIILALIAIFFGIIGALLALSPTIRGGIVSIFSIFIAGIGIILALARLVSRAL